MINALVFLHKNSSLFNLTDELPQQSEPKLILQGNDVDDNNLPDLPLLPE